FSCFGIFCAPANNPSCTLYIAFYHGNRNEARTESRIVDRIFSGSHALGLAELNALHRLWDCRPGELR
ncbi:mCG145551, partial [Mus musculus]